MNLTRSKKKDLLYVAVAAFFFLTACVLQTVDDYISDWSVKTTIALLTQYIFFGLLAYWTASVISRISDKSICSGIIVAIALMGGILFVRLLKYHVFYDGTVMRYLWYSYYIPHCLAPAAQLERNVCPRCGTVHAVRDVSLDVFPAEIVGIVGESGSGKSSLMKCLFFDEEATEGDVRARPFDGGAANLLQLSPQHQRAIRNTVFGMVYQNPYLGLRMDFSSLSNIAEQMIAAGNAPAEALREQVTDLNAKIKAGDHSPIQTGRDVIVITPTYAWRIPRIASDWLAQTELTGAERVWFVMNCGSEIGNASQYNRRLAERKRLRYMGTAQIVMPENYIAMFAVPQAEEARKIVQQAEPDIAGVIARLEAGQAFAAPRNTFYDRFMSGPVNPVFYRFFVKANAFQASSSCTGWS